MDIKKIKELIALLDETEVEEFELEILDKDGAKIKLRKGSRVGNITTNQIFGSGGTAQTQSPQQPLSESPTSTITSEPSEKSPSLEGLVEITSPIVGTFYRAPSPDAPPYVKFGDHIEVGQVVCIVEAMKLMNEIQAEVSGTVHRILVDNAQPVEYGQVLFYIKPD